MVPLLGRGTAVRCFGIMSSAPSAICGYRHRDAGRIIAGHATKSVRPVFRSGQPDKPLLLRRPVNGHHPCRARCGSA